MKVGMFVSTQYPEGDNVAARVPELVEQVRTAAIRRRREGATVDDLVRALISIGSTPRDIIAILQNLRAAGALDAELEVL